MKYLLLTALIFVSGCTTLATVLQGAGNGLQQGAAYNRMNNVQCTSEGSTLGDHYSGTTNCR